MHKYIYIYITGQSQSTPQMAFWHLFGYVLDGPWLFFWGLLSAAATLSLLPGVPLCRHSSRVAGRCAEPKSSAPTSRVVEAKLKGPVLKLFSCLGSCGDLTSITLVVVISNIF